jgi:hypothetical protein
MNYINMKGEVDYPAGRGITGGHRGIDFSGETSWQVFIIDTPHFNIMAVVGEQLGLVSIFYYALSSYANLTINNLADTMPYLAK